MDGSQFDDLTKAFAAGTSRRRMLWGLLGGAATGAISLIGRRRAGASHGRPPGATCIRNEHCASDLCDPQTRRCVCPGGTTGCGGRCVSTTCPTGQTLSNSSCRCLHRDGSAAVRDRGGGDLLFDLPNLQRRHVQRRGRLRRACTTGRPGPLAPVATGPAARPRAIASAASTAPSAMPTASSGAAHVPRTPTAMSPAKPARTSTGVGECTPIECGGNSGVCPAGSQCIANAVCAGFVHRHLRALPTNRGRDPAPPHRVSSSAPAPAPRSNLTHRERGPPK